MEAEELLMPRYKVIADFPQWSVFKYKIDDILYKKGIHFVGSGSARGINENEIDLYPVVFRKLDWHEGRKVQDMPDYVKTKNGVVMKVTGWLSDLSVCVFAPTHPIDINWDRCHTMDILPATSQEYNDYISTNKTHDENQI